MICRCATSRVACQWSQKTAKFLLLSSSISFMVHFPTCSLAFCDALLRFLFCIFLPSRELTYTGYQGIFDHFWRWCSFSHSFPQICAFVPWGLFSFVLWTGSQELPRLLFTDWGFLLVRLHTGVANALAVRGARFSLFCPMGNATGFTRGDNLGGGFVSIFLILFTPILGEMIQFDSCSPNGLKPPTSNGWKKNANAANNLILY